MTGMSISWTGTAQGISTTEYQQLLFKPVPMLSDQQVPSNTEMRGIKTLAQHIWSGQYVYV